MAKKSKKKSKKTPTKKKKSKTTAKAKTHKAQQSSSNEGVWNKTRKVKFTPTLGSSSLVNEVVDTVTYTDNSHAESDSLEFSLDNESGQFLAGGHPYKGESARGKFDRIDWKQKYSVDSGAMSVDSYTASGPSNDVVTVTALSAPSYHEVSSRTRTRTYKNTTLKTIAKKIAKRAKFKLKYYGPSVKIIKRQQDDVTDLEFLTTLCEDYGFRVKIHDKAFIVYSATRFAKRSPAITIPKYWVGDGYQYETDIQGAYGYARNTYEDKKGNKDKESYVYSSQPKFKNVVKKYIQGTLKHTKTMHVSPKGGSGSLGKFAKGSKFVVDAKYPNGWAKVHYYKSYKTKEWVNNSDSTGGQTVTGKRNDIIGTSSSVVGKTASYFGFIGEWCAAFVGWTLKHSGCSHCYEQIRKHSKQNINTTGPYHDWCKKHPAKPGEYLPGDIVVFNWNRNRNGVAHHVGFVYMVSSDRRHIKATIEGNTTRPGSKTHCVAVHYGDHNPFIIGVGHLPLGGTVKSASTAKTRKSSTHRGQHLEEVTVKKRVYGYIYVGKKSQNMTMKLVKHNVKVATQRGLTVDSPGANKWDSKRIAVNRLNKENETIEKLTMTIPGANAKTHAMNVIKLGKDWGGLSGKWFIDSSVTSYGPSETLAQELATHRITGANTKNPVRSVGSVCKFKGGYVHSSSNGGKSHKVKGGSKVRILKVDKKGKYTYMVETVPSLSKKWKHKTVKVSDYTSKDRSVGVNGNALHDGCCASDHLPLYSKVKIGGKVYTVMDRCHGKTDGIMIYHSDPNYKSKGERTVDIMYKTPTSKAKILGWVSSAELSTIVPKASSNVTQRTKRSWKVSHHYIPSVGGSNAVTVWNQLAELGWSAEATACIMGCIEYESGFRVHAVDPIDGGWGICQWSFGRKPRAINWCTKHGGTSHIHVQAMYLDHEMKHSYPSIYRWHTKVGNMPETFDHIICFEDARFAKNKNIRGGKYDWHKNYYRRLNAANYFYHWFATRRNS